MRIKITLSYDGAGFVGWQSQRGGGSIQDYLEEAVFKLTGEKTSVVGSGRTDAGVHALAQVAHFDLSKDWEPRRIPAGLNFYLPQAIRVGSAESVSTDFDSRKTAKQKTYIYVMYQSEFDNALLSSKALRISPEVDLAKMQEAARYFVGTHDFYAFMSAGSSVKTTTRTILDSQIITSSLFETTPLIIYKVTANGFLYNMVRKLTACILRAGLGKIDPKQIPTLIQNKDRSACKETAKPHALYLHSVEYEPQP